MKRQVLCSSGFIPQIPPTLQPMEKEIKRRKSNPWEGREDVEAELGIVAFVMLSAGGALGCHWVLRQAEACPFYQARVINVVMIGIGGVRFVLVAMRDERVGGVVITRSLQIRQSSR